MFKIGIIGSGNMGEALLKGFIQKGEINPSEIIISDINKDRIDELVNRYNVAGTNSNRRVAELSEFIIISVKPKDIQQTLTPLKDILNKDKVVISVAAGVKIEKIKSFLNKNTPIVRVMPNTPVLIGEGVLGVSFDENINSNSKEFILNLLSSVGMTIEVDEKFMDVITGLSGSGPAYVFQFIDALAQGGVKCGLTYSEALKIAVQTVIGSAKLIAETGEHPSVLRDKVTSPGGTTIFGLHQLEKGSFKDTVINAVESATERSKELSE